MPELPEVETTCRGISPHISGQKLIALNIRNPNLRWPIPDFLAASIEGKSVQSVTRRGKYLLIGFESGDVMVHLGMSGSLRVVGEQKAPQKHDHVDFCFQNGQVLRLTDPRRFGSVLWQPKGECHELLYRLGPEPLDEEFNADYLHECCKGKKTAIKQVIMNSKVVVGVGNIYATEALFLCGIDPRRAAGNISLLRVEQLVVEIKKVLAVAITQGGTTLKDFVGGDGKPGYFQQKLNAYGRKGEPCVNCLSPLTEVRLGQRSTVFCKHCQR
ncbi:MULTISPECIES: bifunctional DNA-formamidopyrimidine glycosylase/DNA-(apurinic or apyrimidinic site) lyase [unclassified Neptuniibacter]|uniref:bifunctional DNA-formamidopyrimidine glycosylase/DNA-(apurinic or apyrimidinic site) lyase n=1 Tax=unclassified Neptuniibacter TaxID=2630693 RepID=UPI000C3915E4|nr:MULTISPECIES: bifunctional DNA-formamidopyrimidine glycosylase/DNA-(apurinic or apyrimidinic site) lyase [unclassified Neptuniibacter]MAY42155.1 DNA-formamidopyrimidine glycosylase [Oceanospirillaceae bacterium]|tara:strand:- start:10994 stop:11806 length:813 start_codon:yes stop_codon:yes gene_type:complete